MAELHAPTEGEAAHGAQERAEVRRAPVRGRSGMSEKERGMSDIREKLMEVIANRTAPNAADAILAEFDVAPPTVKPTVEALADALAAEGIDAEPGDLDLTPTAERLLAMLPGRTEAEVKAEALREAASAAVTEGEGIPWNHDHDRATVGAWLEGRADYIEKEAEHG